MSVVVKYANCGSTAHTPHDDRALLTYLTKAGILCGRRDDCARTTPSGMVVEIDSGEVASPFTKTGEETIWAHIVVSNTQSVTFDPGGASLRYDALVLEIINEGVCPADQIQAQNGEGIARFRAVRGSSSSPMSDGDITTALGHSNWIRFDDVNIPISATAFGGGGGDASLEQVIGCCVLSDEALDAFLTALMADLASQANGKGASLISIEDSGTNFIATNVEAALAELFDNISSLNNRTVECRACNGAVSNTLSNPTSMTAFSDRSVAIDTNELVNGVAFTFDIVVEIEFGTNGTVTLGVGLGAASDLGFATTSGTGSTTRFGRIRGKITGTDAPGASVAVRVQIEVMDTVTAATQNFDHTSVNKATNGALTLNFFGRFNASSGGNSLRMIDQLVEKKSSTPF